MRAAKESAVFDLLKHPCFQTGSWKCQISKDPIQLGEYGRIELYLWEGIPVFRLEICFNPPKTRAYIAEQWRKMDILKDQATGKGDA